MTFIPISNFIYVNYRMVFWITSWRSDKETSAVRLFETVRDCMEEIIGMISSQAASAL